VDCSILRTIRTRAAPRAAGLGINVNAVAGGGGLPLIGGTLVNNSRLLGGRLIR
jgi:hypothetical protein